MSVVFGASSPLGKAIVTRLAFAGHTVAAVDTVSKELSAVEEEMKKVGGKVHAVPLDTDEKTTMEKACQTVGGMRGLVFVPPQNAVKGDIVESSLMDFNTVFAQRLTLPFRIVKAAVPLLKQHNESSIVLVNSSSAFTPFVDLGLFSAASSGLLSLSRTLAIDPSVLPVRVNSVVMSTVHSDGSGGVWQDKEAASQLATMIPVGRLGTPSDVGSAVEFLLSRRARYITGEALLLNGGMQLRL